MGYDNEQGQFDEMGCLVYILIVPFSGLIYLLM